MSAQSGMGWQRVGQSAEDVQFWSTMTVYGFCGWTFENKARILFIFWCGIAILIQWIWICLSPNHLCLNQQQACIKALQAKGSLPCWNSNNINTLCCHLSSMPNNAKYLLVDDYIKGLNIRILSNILWVITIHGWTDSTNQHKGTDYTGFWTLLNRLYCAFFRSFLRSFLILAFFFLSFFFHFSFSLSLCNYTQTYYVQYNCI